MEYKIKILVGLFLVGVVLVSGCISNSTPPPDCNEMINPVERSNCFTAMGMIAMREGALTQCEEIQKQEDKDYCYLGLGSAEEDESICNKIQNESVKKECLNKIPK